MVWPRRFHGSVWLTALGALFFLTAIQLAKPVAFFWDDNANEFWPWYAFDYAALCHGVIPQIDFYNYLGNPYLTSGQPAVFYPPVYLSVALAHLFGRPEITIEWLAWVHLAGAAVVMERVARFLGSNPIQAMATGWLYSTLPFITCSPQLWVYNSYTAFYVPLIFLGLELLIQRITFRRVAGLALVKALLFFSGAINYFALSLLFELAYLAVRLSWKDPDAAPQVPRLFDRLRIFARVILAWTVANFLMILLSLPSFGPMVMHLNDTADRSQPMSLELVLDESIHLQTFLCSQVGIFLPDPAARYLYRPGWLFWGGSALAPILLLSTWRSVQVRRFGLLALAAVILSTTAFVLIHDLPGYRSFRWPAKNMLFAGFFYVLAFSAMVRAMPDRWHHVAKLGVLLFGVLTNLVVAFGPESRSGTEFYERHAPVFHVPLEKMQQGRTVLVGLAEGDFFNPDYLGFQFATLVRVPAFAGDDPMVFAQNKREALNVVFVGLPWHDPDDAMVDHLSSWSVRYYFVHELSPRLGYLESHPRFRPMFQYGALRIFEDEQSAPLAYFEDQPQRVVPLQFGDNEVTIDTRDHSGEGTLSVSLVPLAGYSWRQDGGPAQPVPVAKEGRMKIPGIPGGTIIRIRYHEKWLDGFIAIALGTFALLALGFVVEENQRRRTPKL
jgi:hypothetical protein